MKRSRVFTCLFLTLSLLGAGCDASYTSPPISTVSTPHASLQVGSWNTVAEGLSRREDENILSSTASLIVYRFEAGHFSVSFADATSTGRISDWRGASTSSVAIINGEYFQPNGLPSGFLITGGELFPSHPFDLARSGFVIGGASSTIISTSSTTSFMQRTEVLQSYPYLVKDGKADVSSESGKSARRSFVGFDASNNLYLGVVENGDVTLHELSSYLAGMEVHWKNVLNLDGGPSTGLSVQDGEWSETIDSWTSIPNVLMVKRLK